MEPTNQKNKLTIGKLAQITGVHVETIRYYQRRGLLQKPANQPGRIREYSEKDIGHILLIRRAQECGFTLSDIGRLAVYVRDGNCRAIRFLAAQRLSAIDEKLRLLRKSRRSLKLMIDGCRGDCAIACPMFGLEDNKLRDAP